jgi:hypothetical protein
MNRLPVLIALMPVSIGANLAYSTYLKDGFTPVALASDAQGSIYMVGRTDSSRQTIVAKVDAQGSRYVYFTDSGLGSKSVAAAIAVDGAGNAYIAAVSRETEKSGGGAAQRTHGANHNSSPKPEGENSIVWKCMAELGISGGLR